MYFRTHLGSLGRIKEASENVTYTCRRPPTYPTSKLQSGYSSRVNEKSGKLDRRQFGDGAGMKKVRSSSAFETLEVMAEGRFDVAGSQHSYPGGEQHIRYGR